MSSRPGVAIAGAGPAGLVVAHLLQREAKNHRSEFRTPDESVLLEYARLFGH